MTTNGIITTYTIRYTSSSNNGSIDVAYNGKEVSIQYPAMYIIILLLQTQSHNISGISPYQEVRVTITATNGGGTSNASNEVIVKSNEGGMIFTLHMYIATYVCITTFFYYT